MSDAEIRLAALKIAAERDYGDPTQTLNIAKRFYDWIAGGR